MFSLLHTAWSARPDGDLSGQWSQNEMVNSHWRTEML